MEKRLILAIVLSVIILLSWSAIMPRTQHLDSKEVIAQSPAIAPAPINQEKIVQVAPPEENLPTVMFEQDKIKVEFIESQAAIKEVFFKNYPKGVFLLKNGLAINGPSLNFKKVKSADNSITFQHVDDNKKITKEFIFSNTGYELWLEINVQNDSSSPLQIDLPLWVGALDFAPGNSDSQFQDVIAQTKEKTLHLTARKDQEFAQLQFIAVRNRYFCAILQPEKTDATGLLRKVNANILQAGVMSQTLLLSPGAQMKEKFHIYLGPQELRLIKTINPQWSTVVYYGTFDFISQLLLQALEFIYKIVRNWGVAVIILSLLVYILLFPLTLKQMRSMKEMQLLQPKIEQLRATYKDNPQRLNKEIMELYKEHKVNPFGGCLPLILQIPIFFALYQALMRSTVLKGANFLWIKDLSEPDRLFTLKFSLPLLGNEFNILPILMAIGMFVQQKISSVGAVSSTTAEQQKMMTIIMPILFGFIFYHMPAGLVLYWFVNSMLMLAYQFRIRVK
jgi:YidC/Oxa1 family membrane protein insertase